MSNMQTCQKTVQVRPRQGRSSAASPMHKKPGFPPFSPREASVSELGTLSAQLRAHLKHLMALSEGRESIKKAQFPGLRRGTNASWPKITLGAAECLNGASVQTMKTASKSGPDPAESP